MAATRPVFELASDLDKRTKVEGSGSGFIRRWRYYWLRWTIQLRAALVTMILACSLQGAWSQSCSVTAANGSYGVVDILSGAVDDTTATFSINCTGTANQTVRLCVELSPGQTNAAGNRRLASGSERLVHELYSDASRTTIWGSWGLATTSYGLYPIGATYDLALGSSGSAGTALTVYGRVFSNQTAAGPGSYVWTMTTAPAASYDYKTASACPTGSRQATSSGSTWTATINANCNVSATNVNFGSVGVLASNVDSTGSVTVRCTDTTPYNIGLSAGAGSGATVASRKMTSGAKTVTYSLYSDSGRASVWGNAIGTDTASGTGTGLDQPYTVYARAPAQTTPAPGAYTDTIVVTVTY
ncbi:MAG: spore coat protein U domain-containing protein [Mesorhizobium sp.]|nr:spore coat protein U domain-containing protein [Mesorhizobium opportunistum]TJV45725.1 MAG: spore coat protein U domain-containing protein [Mesorhizobium sp.]WJI36360.1 spore coat U domain-containing protein [Mesorhizobium opportunistum]